MRQHRRMNEQRILFEAPNLALTRVEAADAVDVSPATLDRNADCARAFTRNGDHIPSGNRDPETGITPMDNFVC